MGLAGKILMTGVLSLLGLILMAKEGHGYMVHEIEPGILEMRGFQDGSLEIRKVFVDKSKKFIYFEVQETRPGSGLTGGLGSVPTKEVRYFYAPYKEAKLNKAQRLRFIQYGIGLRVFNTRGKIPFGPQRFFYPIVYFQTLS